MFNFCILNLTLINLKERKNTLKPASKSAISKSEHESPEIMRLGNTDNNVTDFKYYHKGHVTMPERSLTNLLIISCMGLKIKEIKVREAVKLN
jgi:hypothetical protein